MTVFCTAAFRFNYYIFKYYVFSYVSVNSMYFSCKSNVLNTLALVVILKFVMK